MKIISLEGPDFSGKSTLANALVSRLRKAGRRVEKTETPTKMVTGIFTQLLRNSKDKVDPRVYALVYAADHLHHHLSIKDIDADIVVMERGILSFFVYQQLVMGVDRKWMEEVNRYNGTIPDLTVIVKVPTGELLKRSRIRVGLKDAFEKEEFMRKVIDAFYNLPDWLVKKYNVVYMEHDADTERLAGKIASML